MPKVFKKIVHPIRRDQCEIWQKTECLNVPQGIDSFIISIKEAEGELFFTVLSIKDEILSLNSK